jgi:CRISPR/Cas system-associated exonuclease Cas4 (RecB family)
LRCSYLERKYGHEESYKEVWVKQRGKALHRQLSYAFEGWKELPIRLPIHLDDEDIEVIGHIDAYDPERAEMTEFKSTRFVNWQKKNKILPHRHHVEQLQSYFSIWTSVYRLPVKKLFIAYMDDQTPPERFEIEPHDVTARLEERAIQLHNSLLQDAAPAADPSSLCHYCPFEASCRY